MKQKKLIFGCLAGLLFMAFTAVNVTVSKSYQLESGNLGFSLSNLIVKAASGNEFECADDQYPSICSSIPGTNCFVPADPCH